MTCDFSGDRRPGGESGGDRDHKPAVLRSDADQIEPFPSAERASRRPEQTREHRAMADDAELQLFRSSVNCATGLEGMAGGWRLDVRESTRRALKYRRGKGEFLIVTHDGHGWWDPLSQAKGDIFDLVQYLDRSLNFGQVRQVLRCFVGVAPTYPTAIRAKQGRGPNRLLKERWAKRPRLR
jgi:hypothetical protein